MPYPVLLYDWTESLELKHMTCTQAIRRGTWLAAQLQLVFVFVMVLLAIQAQLHLSSLPQSTLDRVLALAVPYIATLVVAAVMFRQPWDLPPKKDAVKGASLDRSEEQRNPEQASEGAEVDSRIQRQPSEPAREVDSGPQTLSGQQVSISPRITTLSKVAVIYASGPRLLYMVTAQCSLVMPCISKCSVLQLIHTHSSRAC